MKYSCLVLILVIACMTNQLFAVVGYQDDGAPWNMKPTSGPDVAVGGWYYNLGITGMRAELMPKEPKSFLIKYVFEKTPADKLIQIGDVITGVNGKPFEHAHVNGVVSKGYGPYGADPLISEFADALEACQSKEGKGKLTLTVRRGDKTKDVTLNVGTKYGCFSPTFPTECKKSERILADLLNYLVVHQEGNGSFGNAVPSTFAPLALLASGDRRYLPAIERCARYLAETTTDKETKKSGLINWHYMCAAIVLSEYYLATKQAWIKPELQQICTFLQRSQYMDKSQLHPEAKKSHPGFYPKKPNDAHGGWGHDPDYQGYGPITIITGEGAIAYSLMQRCGIEVDRGHHDAAYDFLKRATMKDGQVLYKDYGGGGRGKWGDLGRMGVTGVACFIYPYAEPDFLTQAKLNVTCINNHPDGMTDSHGSPILGMGYVALAASFDDECFRKVMDVNRWWFTLAQCGDNGSFYYQPTKEIGGSGKDDLRMLASSVTAFIFSMPKKKLVITGRQDKAPKTK